MVATPKDAALPFDPYASGFNDDPYRHWPTLGEVDLYLIGEGRHEKREVARRLPGSLRHRIDQLRAAGGPARHNQHAGMTVRRHDLLK